MEVLRLELDAARETLRIIRAGGFDALVINAGGGSEVFALGGAGPAYRLLVGVLAEGSVGYFRAVALDFDGTLADGQVAPATLAALTGARARAIRVILVTGRIMSELRAVFPEVDEHTNAVVAENGAVLVTHGGVRLLADPIGGAVSAALSGRGVAHRRGRVIVAGAAADEPAALEVVRELGLDCRLVRNRGELMILPAGVTKGPACARRSAIWACRRTTRSASATARTTTACWMPARSEWPSPTRSTPSARTPT